MKLLSLLLLLSIPMQAAWTKVYKLTATGVAASSNQSNFGCYVYDDSGALATTAHGGYVQNTYTAGSTTWPADLVFSSSSTVSPYIPFEIESWNATTGVMSAWVNCATLYGTGASPTQTVIYLAVGNSAITTAQNTGSYASSAVWNSNYSLVLHYPTLGGGTLGTNDSTSHAANQTGGSAAGTATGEVDGAVSFTGGGGIVGGAIPTTYTTYTMSAWFKSTNFSSNSSFPYQSAVFYASQSSSGMGIMLGDATSGHSGMVGLLKRGVVVYVFTSLQCVVNHVNYVSISVNGTSATAYLWDVTAGTNASQTLTVSSESGNGSYIVGNFDSGALVNFDGWIDEVRLAATNLSGDWITEEFTNQSNPGKISAAGFWTWTVASAGSTKIRHQVMN